MTDTYAAAPDLEERIDYKVLAQQPGGSGAFLTVEFTLRTAVVTAILEWDGSSALDLFISGLVPVRDLRRKLLPPAPPPPDVTGKHGHIIIVAIPDSA
jgi:hypothetical protein